MSRLLRIAQAADAPVVIVHLTNREALLEVDHARKRGQTVYVETCPQYLLLDESVYFNEDYSAAARYVCAPPLRDKAEQEHLWKGLRRGAIQTVSTDHCSLHPGPEGHGPGGLHQNPRRPARRGDPGRAAVLLRRGQAEDQRRPDVPGAQRESRPAVWSLSPEGASAARQRRGHRGLRPGASHVIRAEDCVANVDYNPYEGFVTAAHPAGVAGAPPWKTERSWWRRRRAYMARGKNSL